MIINYFGDKLTPERWEEICDTCYRNRYQSDNYQKILANYGGDAGIEGFTRSGIVYQCYYPEKQYNDNEYYEHLRNKVTKDINKLLNNIERLKEFGVKIIKQWHFVIPSNRDSRILKHLNNKRLEIKKAKELEPNKYDIISNDFDIVLKTAEDFNEEIFKYIKHDIGENKIKIDLIRDDNLDISKCDSEKVANIKRKIKAIMNCEEDCSQFKEVVNAYITSYMAGLELLYKLNKEWPSVYQEIHELIEANKNKVYRQSRFNIDNSLNKNVFDSIMDKFEQSLKEIKVLSAATIIELTDDIIAGWLADCSMEFK